jgi:hypothetical protein
VAVLVNLTATNKDNRAMAKWYDYVIEVAMRLKTKDATPKSLDALKEYLGEQYVISESSMVKDMLGFDPDELNDEDQAADELTATLQVQTAFTESQMDDDEPTEEALAELHAELTAYLEAKYQVEDLELLDDGLNSYLLGEREEDE